MVDVNDKAGIDPYNRIEQVISGCKVRLYFGVEHNEETERMVIYHLMQLFDRRMHMTALACNDPGTANEDADKLHVQT